MASKLDIALDYITLNPTRYLFPVVPLAKTPLIKNNLNDASNDPDQLCAWHAEFATKKREPNWAVAIRKSKIIVFDVDTKPGKVGADTLFDLSLAYDFPYEDTEANRSPSGGLHYYFDGPGYEFYIGGFGRDIDSPHYVLIPGMELPNGFYTVYQDKIALPTRPWMAEVLAKARTRKKEAVADANTLVDELDQRANIEWAVDYLKNDADIAIEGQNGDITTLKVALSLRDHSISQAVTFDLMMKHWNDRCEPPWDAEGLNRKIENAWRYANKNAAGGKSATAEFSTDDVPEIRPFGDPILIEKQRQARGHDRQKEAQKIGAGEQSAADRYGKNLQHIIDEYVWVAEIERFVSRKNPRLRWWKKSQFDQTLLYLVNKKTMGPSLSSFLLARSKNTIERLDSYGYFPMKPRIFEGHFNFWTPSDVVPAEGDTTIWDEHLNYLFQDEESRDHVLNWLAWFVQNPEKKPNHALLMYGRIPGTGKSFITHVLKKIVGEQNASNPQHSELIGRFNGWAKYSKLVVIEELRAPDRTEVKNHLHSFISEPYVRVEEKGVNAVQMENYGGVIAMTNSDNPISLDDKDRRYLVVRTNAEPREQAYYDMLYPLVQNKTFVAAVAHQLMTRDLHGYNGQSHAPDTDAKKAMYEAGLSDLEQWIVEHESEWPFGARVVTMSDLHDAIPRQFVGRTVRLIGTINSILIKRYQPEKLPQRVTLPDGRRSQLIALHGKGGLLRNLDPQKLVEIYEADMKKAPANRGLSDDSAEADFS